jgi:hypothetical protein
MKRNIIYLTIIFWLAIACQSNKPQNTEIIDSSDGYSLEELEVMAATDSSFRNSKAYSFYMEKACLEHAKTLSQVNDKGKLLKEFEKSIISLRESTNKIKANPSLSKDKKFSTLVQLKADRVREYQQLLKKLPLTEAEEKEFVRICKM